MSEMGERLKQARIAAGHISARSAALKFGWTPSTYGAHENGQAADSVRQHASWWVRPEMMMKTLSTAVALVMSAGAALAQPAGSPDDIDALCVRVAMKSLGPQASKVSDVKVSREAPTGYDHDNLPGFLRYMSIETTIGSFKSKQNFRCSFNYGVTSAVPDT